MSLTSFEAVEIEHDQGTFRAGLGGRGEFAGDGLIEGSPIGEACQSVLPGFLLDIGLIDRANDARAEEFAGPGGELFVGATYSSAVFLERQMTPIAVEL